MKNAPLYAITSVDSALRLAAALQVEGPLSVSEAADRLEVARSTAHRLLAMLVYRDFAEQLPDRRYGAGPVLRGEVPQAPVARLREVALPHLRRVVDAVGETANVMVLAGSDVRFVGTVECDHVLRVGDRSGRTLPAHLASGGKAVLATLGPEELAAALGSLDEVAAVRLERELRTVRRRGFAVNDQETERGLTAVGVAVPSGTIQAALSLAVPTARYSRADLPRWGAVLAAAAADVARDLTPV
ncbi:IclR family transcriptional regulator [Geodermatophilus sp. TF02-6]|uniref:IclR family transcriptional regulator n=1 Tax=Geodermatophilus sp. TF02-6 TaxID=2250575 RepID=UPI000DEBBDAA|nr:IclR family transcriptional regulator C-terminal domain-containing protein [Geodermatophilus sp. TF02-6]RBY83778.1 IclR family transcriptional regulator [Geodermatophilus sp. TF02-6]